MRYQRLIPSFVLGFLLVAIASRASAQTPSTPEERARLVAITHKLETNPLDASLRSEREWALKWVIQVPDISVSICPTIVGDFHKYKYAPELTGQLLLSSAAFVIENPDKSGDRLAQYVAGAEGVLKAYDAILHQDAKAKSKPLDEMREKQSEGKLKETIQDVSSKTCSK